jgi:hypothetical protein
MNITFNDRSVSFSLRPEQAQPVESVGLYQRLPPPHSDLIASAVWQFTDVVPTSIADAFVRGSHPDPTVRSKVAADLLFELNAQQGQPAITGAFASGDVSFHLSTQAAKEDPR